MVEYIRNKLDEALYRLYTGLLSKAAHFEDSELTKMLREKSIKYFRRIGDSEGFEAAYFSGILYKEAQRPKQHKGLGQRLRMFYGIIKLILSKRWATDSATQFGESQGDAYSTILSRASLGDIPISVGFGISDRYLEGDLSYDRTQQIPP